MKQIDEQGYKDGGAAFHKGKTLRSLVEVMINHHENKYEDYRKAEAYTQSYQLGFADALLAKLRTLR